MSQKPTYILALDQGTTSSRALLIDRAGRVHSSAQRDFKQHFPKGGWVEHDAMEIWATQSAVMTEALAAKNVNGSQIAAIGITNQRETTVLWNRLTGKPLYRAIVWQDRRTAPRIAELIAQGHEAMITDKTGLVPDAYFSASKLQWLLDHVEGARDMAERGELAFGTIDTWLVWKLTAGAVHVTDVSNASRTMLFNMHERCWDTELLDLFDIPESVLPEVRSSSEVYGHTSGQLLYAKIPIAGIAGDQQAALFGQCCFEPGMAKTTYGTGCFMVMNTGYQPVVSDNKLLSTVAWEINGQMTYALEGSVFIGGAAVQWLRDNLGFVGHASETERLATQLPDNEGVYFVPAMAGLGAPHWDANARGAFFGITRGTTIAHMTRATLEAIAYQVHDVLRAMEADRGEALREMRVDGGAAGNNFLMQFQADMLRCTVARPENIESTALGAAFLAGLAVGYWEDLDTLKKIWQSDHNFEATMNREQSDEYLRFWHKAVERAKNWCE
ncbi:MAG: glycerol kinase [Cryomorphaceae bacterium]|nr:MAG: glycerol kinase [Cryomorphaceae bacterium]